MEKRKVTITTEMECLNLLHDNRDEDLKYLKV